MASVAWFSDIRRLSSRLFCYSFTILLLSDCCCLFFWSFSCFFRFSSSMQINAPKRISALCNLAWQVSRSWGLLIRIKWYVSCASCKTCTQLMHLFNTKVLPSTSLHKCPIHVGWWMLPSKYSAHGIFQHHFQWKKCTLYSIKNGSQNFQPKNANLVQILNKVINYYQTLARCFLPFLVIAKCNKVCLSKGKWLGNIKVSWGITLISVPCSCYSQNLFFYNRFTMATVETTTAKLTFCWCKWYKSFSLSLTMGE